jgi:hypothetical protein
LATLSDSRNLALRHGVFLWEDKMDEGFPPHVVGFMKRRREKEKEQKPADEKS